ncbi:MAG: light-harvesting protein [Pseudomonadota bacterium]
MNNAKMWLVVPPAVGVPVFLGAVAVGSFAVHVAVVSNTSWVSDFLMGQEMGTDDMASVVVPSVDTDTAKVAYTYPMEDGAQMITVIMPDGTTARAILQPNEVLASAASPLVVQSQ